MRFRLSGSMVLCAVLALAGAAIADTVYFKNGRVMRNVRTRVEGDRLVVMQADVEMAFPMDLVERVDKSETTRVERAPSKPENRPDPAGEQPPDVAGQAADPGEEESLEENRDLEAYLLVSDSDSAPITHENKLDRISFLLPDGSWRRREWSDGQHVSYARLNTDRLAAGEVQVIWPTLTVWYQLVEPGLQALQWSEEQHASRWFANERRDMGSAYRERKSPEEGERRISGRRYYTMRIWIKDGNVNMDGIYLLYFPRNFDRQQNRFYVFKCIDISGADVTGVEIDLDVLDTAVSRFQVWPRR